MLFDYKDYRKLKKACNHLKPEPKTKAPGNARLPEAFQNPQYRH
jgi:hypothetical protein